MSDKNPGIVKLLHEPKRKNHYKVLSRSPYREARTMPSMRKSVGGKVGAESPKQKRKGGKEEINSFKCTEKEEKARSRTCGWGAKLTGKLAFPGRGSAAS